MDIIPLCRAIPTPNVHCVGDDLKGVKRDANGENKTCNGWNVHHRQARKIEGKKVIILKKEQKREADTHRKCGKCLCTARMLRSAFANAKAKQICQGQRCDHKEHVNRLSPCIKKEACEKQCKVLPSFGCDKVDNQHRRQICK